jgi:heme exporter protein CcmD
MINNLYHFFYMGGYGLYVWSAYGCMLIFLTIQWFIPWQTWKKYVKKIVSAP